MINMRKTDWFMISNWLISDEKKNLILLMCIWVKMTSALAWYRTTIPEIYSATFYPLHHKSFGGMGKTLVGNVAYVLNLVWTWNYCCKLEIVWADGSTFVVTMPWGKIIDGELSIFFLWDLITLWLGTIISTTMGGDRKKGNFWFIYPSNTFPIQEMF